MPELWGTPSSPKAPVSLNAIVVGGGISGIATAYTLQKAGHKVLVCEASKTPLRGPGGVMCPPNMARCLDRWGLTPRLSKKALKCPQFTFRQGESGDPIGIIFLHKQFLAELMADFYFVQHADLHEMLCDVATEEGVDIRYNTKVTSVDPVKASVTLEGGEVLEADFIVGAEGASGNMIRSAVVDEKVEEEKSDVISVVVVVPVESLANEADDVKQFMSKEDWSAWLGDGYMVGVSLINSRKDLSVAITIPIEHAQAGIQVEERWDEVHGNLDKFGIDVQRLEPRLRTLIKHGKSASATLHVRRPPLPSLAKDGGRCILVGDAAHTLSPVGSYTAALGIEDAEVLGRIMSRIDDYSHLQRFLSAYEEIRSPRCAQAAEWDHHKRILLTLNKGEAQDKRNENLKVAMAFTEYDQMDEDSFEAIWGKEMHSYSYNATETVDDWWTKWGSLLNSHRLSQPRVRVSISKDRETTTSPI